MSDEIRVNSFNILPPVVKNLLIINGLFYLAKISFASLEVNLDSILGLHFFGATNFHVWQIFSYMFMHGNFGHLFFNMFALWMFGSAIENTWGGKKFLFYYLITGIGAAFIHYLVIFFQIHGDLHLINQFLKTPELENLILLTENHRFHINPTSGIIYDQFQNFQNIFIEWQSNSSHLVLQDKAITFIASYKEYFLNSFNVIGASGSVFGLLLAFGMMFPNSRIYLYFLFPIKAKWFVIGYGALELFFGITGTADGIAHFAHLGGMIFGIILILIWRKYDRNKRDRFYTN